MPSGKQNGIHVRTGAAPPGIQHILFSQKTASTQQKCKKLWYLDGHTPTVCPARILSRQTEQGRRVPSSAQGFWVSCSLRSSISAVTRRSVWAVWADTLAAATARSVPRSMEAHSWHNSCSASLCGTSTSQHSHRPVSCSMWILVSSSVSMLPVV